jgi:hypothetical protein
MKKLIIYFAVVAFAFLNVFASCEEDAEQRNNRAKKAKRYFTKYDIHDTVDSTYTDITVYVGEIDGHKYKYHLFSGKNKSQMFVEHPIEECKKCSNKKK